MNELKMSGAFEIWLKMLDAQYQRIRAIHSDPSLLNDETPEYRKLREDFDYIQCQIFQFKSLWAFMNRNATDLAVKSGGNGDKGRVA